MMNWSFSIYQMIQGGLATSLLPYTLHFPLPLMGRPPPLPLMQRAHSQCQGTTLALLT